MILEHQLIPYEPSEIPSGSWIVFAPHADDETIGLGGSLLMASARGIAVTLVVMTDGAQGGEASTRREEARSVSEKLRCRELIFLDEPDRALDASAALIERITELLERVRPDCLFFPSPLELHPDHRAATEIVWLALQNHRDKPRLFAYEVSSHGMVNRLVDVTPVIEQKQALLGLYESQLTQNSYMDHMLATSRLRSYTLPGHVKYAEGFFEFAPVSELNFRMQIAAGLQPFLQTAVSWSKESTPALRKDVLAGKPDPARKVSVIIPCFNDGPFVSDAVESVESQSYPNVELILVDDASTDPHTLNVLTQLQARGHRMVRIDENSGPAVARNVGISHASGEYILPLDADDKIDPLYLEKAVEVLDASPETGIVYCRARFFGDSTATWELPEFNFSDMLLSNMIFVSALFRKADWSRAGGYNPNMRLGYEDYDFWLSMLALSLQVSRLDETLFYCRRRPLSRNQVHCSDYENVLQSHVQIFHNHRELYERNIEVFFRSLHANQGTIETLNALSRELRQKTWTLETALEQTEHRLEELSQAHRSLHREHQRTVQQLAATAQQLANTTRQLEEQTTHAHGQTEQIAHHKETIHALLNSKSMRITRPLRNVSRYFRSLGAMFKQKL